MFNHYSTFGDADVPYTRFGKSQTGHVTEALNCGDPAAVQQMLNDLGFPVGAVDGSLGNKTFAALKAFAATKGVPYTPGSFPKGAICSALADAWTALKAPPPVTKPVAPAAPVWGGQLNLQSMMKQTLAQKQAAAAAAQAAAAQAAAQEASLAEQAKGWSTPAKVAIGAAALAAVGAFIYFAVVRKGPSQSYQANKSKKKPLYSPAEVRKLVKDQGYTVKELVSMAQDKHSGAYKASRGLLRAMGYDYSGKSKTRSSGKKRKRSTKSISASKLPETCRTHRPKGYPTSKALYALPECWMYPLDNKKNVRAAASRFGKHRRRYSKAVQAKIAKRLDAAERKFGIGAYHL